MERKVLYEDKNIEYSIVEFKDMNFDYKDENPYECRKENSYKINDVKKIKRKESLNKKELKKYMTLKNSVNIATTMDRIERKEDKLTITTGISELKKEYNMKYFSKHTTWNHLTINFKTGNIFIIRDIRYTKIKKRNFYANNFRLHHLYYHFEEIFKNDKMMSIIEEELNYKILSTKLGENIKGISAVIRDYLFLWFSKHHSVKLPNNWVKLIKYFPGVEILRKEKKYIKAVLKKAKAYNKKANTFFQSSANKNILFFSRILSPEYFSLIKKDELPLDSLNLELNTNENEGRLENNIFNLLKPYFRLEKDEQLNIVKLIKLEVSGIADHIRMIVELKEKTNKRWLVRSNGKKSFAREHAELSKELIKLDEKLVKYKFTKEMIEKIEKPINDFEPVILKSSEMYLDEGIHQSNCVYSYRHNSKRSFIVSLRKNNFWITCEFDYEGKCLQYQGKYNKLDTKIKELDTLKKRLRSLSNLKIPITEY